MSSAPPSFWTTLRAEFRSLAERAEDLRVVVDDTPLIADDQRFSIESVAAILREAAAAKGASTDWGEREEAHAAARTAKHYETLVREGRQMLYGLNAGSRDVQAQFRSLAIRGAVGADLVTAAAPHDDAFGAWLKALQDRGLGDRGIDGVIEKPCEASIVLCQEFETDAYRREVLTKEESSPVSSPGGTVQAELPINANPEQKRQAVKAFLEVEAARAGRRIPQAAIWRAAHYNDRSQYERWIHNRVKMGGETDENFRRVLRGDRPLILKTDD